MDYIKINKLIRSRRRTVGIEITHEGELIVRAPNCLKLKRIRELLKQKAEWINEKQKKSKARPCRRAEFRDGEEFLLYGNCFNLRFKQGKMFLLGEPYKIEQKDKDSIRKHMILWYKEKAGEYINPRVEELADKFMIDCGRIRITGALKRWGSCSGKNNLNFSYRLAMAPLSVIDYVIVHELVHINERNHSKRFWEKVKQAMPDYERYKGWLENNGHMLVI